MPQNTPLFDYCFTCDKPFKLNDPKKPINVHIAHRTFINNMVQIIELKKQNQYLIQKVLTYMDDIKKKFDEVGL